MTSTKKDPYAIIRAIRTNEAPDLILTMSLLSNTYHSSRSPIRPTRTIDPLTQLPREILDEILQLVFTKTYSLGQQSQMSVPEVLGIKLRNPHFRTPEHQQPTHSPGIFRTCSSLSKIALQNFYSTRFFKLDPLFQDGHLMPALSQAHADLLQNVSFTVSDRVFGTMSRLRRSLQTLEHVPGTDTTDTTTLRKFTGDTVIRRSCTVTYHMTSPSGDFQRMNHIILTVSRRFTGFKEVTFTIYHQKVKDYRTSEMHMLNGTILALVGVVRDIRTQLEPTLGNGTVTGPETLRAGGEEGALPCFLATITFYPRRYWEETLYVGC